MLVRCVTLSLDRFENQVDMKGKKRSECQGKEVQCNHPGVRHPAFSRETRKAGSSHTKCPHGWGQDGGSRGDIFFTAFTSLYCLCFL